MSEPMKVIDLFEALRVSLSSLFYGPSFPVALCKCGTRLHFERHDYRPEWQCWCPDCVDGDYDYETGRTVATYPIGDGKTLFDALDDYAIRCDVETESLFAKEGM